MKSNTRHGKYLLLKDNYTILFENRFLFHFSFLLEDTRLKNKLIGIHIYQTKTLYTTIKNTLKLHYSKFVQH